MYKTKSFDQLSVNSMKRIGGIYPFHHLSRGICVRQPPYLEGFQYESNVWKKPWSEKIFNERNDYHEKQFPWFITDRIVPGKDVIIVVHPDGVKFYEVHDSKLEFICEDGNFHEVYKYDKFLIGNVYAKDDRIGVIARKASKKIEFCYVTNESLKDDDPLYLVNQAVTNEWYTGELSLTQLTNIGPQVIVLRSDTGLKFHQFDENDKLRTILDTKIFPKPKDTKDWLFFGNFTRNKFQDILHLNSSGLFVFRHDGSDYKHLYRDTTFTEASGWRPDFADTINVQDFDNDGIDDLIFTSSKGITILSPTFTETFSWKSMLNTDSLGSNHKFGRIISALPQSNPTLFVQSLDGTLVSLKLEREDATEPSTTVTALPETSTAPSFDVVIPDLVKRIVPSQKVSLWWANQYDQSIIKDPVDFMSGHVRFEIPLVDVAAETGWRIPFVLMYSGEHVSSSQYHGYGWATPMLGQDYIMVDYQGSVFEEKAKYYLSSLGNVQLLEFFSVKDGIQQFRIANEEKQDEDPFNIEYHEKEETWVIESEAEKVVYGQEQGKGALQRTLFWLNWRGIGRESTGMVVQTIGWYLKKRIDKKKSRQLSYVYEVDSESLNGLAYTTAVRLVKIVDEKDFNLTLHYAKKGNEEYIKRDHVDKEGNIVFPIPLLQSHYMTRYSLSTSMYEQEIRFEYTVKGDKRLLAQLTQYQKPLMQFEYYDGDDHVLNKLEIFPFQLSFNFEYDKFVSPNVVQEAYDGAFNFPIKVSPKIAYGQDYTVLSYISVNKIFFEVYSKDFFSVKTDCNSSNFLTCPYIKDTQKDYTLIAYENIFVILIDNVLQMVERNDKGEWREVSAVYNFHTNYTVNFDQDLIVIAEPQLGKLHVFDYSKGHYITRTFDVTVKRVIVEGRNIIVSHAQSLSTIYYDKYLKVWTMKNLSGTYEFSHSWIRSRFDMVEDLSEHVVNFLDSQIVQVYENIVSVTNVVLDENSHQLHLRINIVYLDASHNIITERKLSLQNQYLFKLTYEIENEGTTFYFEVVKHDKYRIRVKSFSGALMDEIRKKNKSEKKRRKAIQQVLDELNNKNDEFQDLFKQLWGEMVKWNKFGAQISSQGIYVADDTIVRNTGTDWKSDRTTLSDPIHLSDKFSVVMSDDRKIVDLFNEDKVMKNFKLEDPALITYRFPRYIASQPTNTSINLLTFKNEDETGIEYSFEKELIQIPFCNFENIVSLKNVTDDGTQQEMVVRPLTVFQESKRQYEVTKVSLVGRGLNTRVTSFERKYHVDKLDKNIVSSVDIITGGDKSKFGWREMTRIFDIRKQSPEVTYRWFNATGFEMKKEIVNLPKDDEDQEDESDPRSPFTILDETETLIISDCAPMKLEDEMCAYYGFEEYETGVIGNVTVGRKWKFDMSNIVRDHFSLTGRSFLELSDPNDNFLGMFHPKDQNFTYIGSTWFHPTIPVKLNAETDHLQAMIGTSTIPNLIGLNAEVKYKDSDWYYAEVTIDFDILKIVHDDYIDHYNLTIIEDPEFHVTLKLEAHGDTVAFDHIRFSPISHDFEANVFEARTGNNIEIIQNNGLISRTIYDHLGEKEVTTIQQNGNVLQFVTATQTGDIPGVKEGVLDKRSSEVTLVPEHGFLETFDASAFRDRWQILEKNSWQAAKRQLIHIGDSEDSIWPKKHIFDNESVAIRFYYVLEETNSAITLTWNGSSFFTVSRTYEGLVTMITPFMDQINGLPTSGELLIFVEDTYSWIWLDGILLIDAKVSDNKISWTKLSINVTKKVLIENFFVFNKPQVTVEYKNALGSKEQIIQYLNPTSAIVIETLYDELERESIVTKPTKISRNKHLLKFHKDFVTNKNVTDESSVWKTGILTGGIAKANPNDFGYSYHRVEYALDPLNRKIVSGQPGREYNTVGDFSQRESYDPEDIAHLRLLFPKNKGFTYHAKYEPNGMADISVMDAQERVVAKYTQVPSYDHLLSTYEYDKNGNLLKILPPLYHEKANTASKTTEYVPGENHLTEVEKALQLGYGTYFHYNDHGQLIQKYGSDIGTINFLYNSFGELRFLSTTKENVTETVYFDYDNNHFVQKAGQIVEDISLVELEKMVDVHLNDLPFDQEEHQAVENFEDHPEPLLRNKVKNFITHFDDIPIIERVNYDEEDKVTNKTIIIGSVADQFTDLAKTYVNDRVKTLTYPSSVDEQPLELIHSYNILGQLISIGTKDSLTKYGKFTYNGDGTIESETFNNNYRQYKYNSPGFLTEISDRFLSEKMTYMINGYGQAGFADGIVMSATYEPKWVETVDQRWFQVNEHEIPGNFSKDCFRALRDEGYVNHQMRPEKVYGRANQIELPLECAGRTSKKIAEILDQKSTPKVYGHRFSYGNHQELIKAKYFRDETASLMKPLQPVSFYDEMPSGSISKVDSEKIWKLLTNAKFVISNQKRYDAASAIGTRGIVYFIRFDEIFEELKNSSFIGYIEAIERLLYVTLSEGRLLSSEEFIKIFLKWENVHKGTSIPIVNIAKEKGHKLWKILNDNDFIPTVDTTKSLKHLTSSFRNLLQDYHSNISDVAKILSTHFIYSLGEHPFDLESFKIDPNGNHRKFYSGFKQLELEYETFSNQVKSVRVESSDKPYLFRHDIRGNVIKAEHKNIELIEYHPLSQRMTKVQMKDGRVLNFLYNAQGARVLKRVYDPDGSLTTEIYYVRDEKNRVLVDRHTKFVGDDARVETVTKYVYGPRGLLGFERKGNFYNVFLDHLGSVRLVIKDSQVVAAYDYLPYGELMREFGTDPDGICRYRFNAQEWDEETGLYVFHARVYDPTIGRFYQIDPKSQSFSPYKYSGNSPISFVDPDGQFFWLIVAVIVGAVLGAYLGGASANGTWNPIKWDWKSGKTWAGIAFGAVGGATLPIGFGASISIVGIAPTIALGTVGAYLTAAAQHGWNPAKWDWSDPSTFNALFQGFSTGTGIPGGIKVIHTAAAKINSVAWARTFLFASYGTVVGVTYWGAAAANDMNFAFWKWDWKDPKTFSAIFDSFSSGIGMPDVARGVVKGIFKNLKSPNLAFKSVRESVSSRKAFTAILKNPKHPMYKTVGAVVMGYMLGSAANEDFNPLYWNYASFSTYEQVLYGLSIGKHTESLLKLAKVPKMTKPYLSMMKSVFKGDFFVHKMIKVIGYSTIESYINHIMRNSMNKGKKNYWLKRLDDEGHPPSVIKDADEFLSGNHNDLTTMKRKIPNELQRLIATDALSEVSHLNRALDKFESSSKDIYTSRHTIFPSDKSLSFFECGGSPLNFQQSIAHSYHPTSQLQVLVSKDNPMPELPRYRRNVPALTMIDNSQHQLENNNMLPHLKQIEARTDLCQRFRQTFQSPPMTGKVTFTHVDTYTQSHFHGLLQLFDIAIRKLTGRTAEGTYNEMLHILMTRATEIIDQFEQTVESAFASVGVDLTEVDVDEISYRLYENVNKLLKHDKQGGLKTIVDDAVLEISYQLCQTHGIDTAEAFLLAFDDEEAKNELSNVDYESFYAIKLSTKKFF